MKPLRGIFLIALAMMFFSTQAQAVLFWARPYDPNLGRWIQRDPIGEPGGANLYGYVENNPINNVDPLGLNFYPMRFIGPIQPGDSYFGNGLIYTLQNDGSFQTSEVESVDNAGLQASLLGELLLPGGGFLMAPEKGFTVCAAKAVLNPKIYSQLEKQLAKDGAASVQQALQSATKTLAEHEAKLQQILKEGGYSSQVETTIRNVKNQIETLQQFIKDNGL